MYIGVLDICPREPGVDPRETIAETIETAVIAERLGATRYWLAEHQSGSVHAAPEILTPILAGSTDKISIGPAGILLSLYQPLKIAEQFLLTATMFPGRIDLGLARGRVPSRLARAMCGTDTPDYTLDTYRKKVEQVTALLDPAQCEFADVPIECRPSVWMLGTGLAGAEIAADFRLKYCHGVFFRGATPPETVLGVWKQRGDPSGFSVAVAGICLDARGERGQSTHTSTGNDIIVPSFVDSPRLCAERLQEIAASYGAHEVIYLDLTPHPEARRVAIGLLLEEWQQLHAGSNR